jgi:membrane-associated phospholipid phosphatase
MRNRQRRSRTPWATAARGIWLAAVTLALLPCAAAAQESEGGFRAFIRDVGRDYKNLFSVENGEWAVVGSTVTLAIHQQDEALRVETEGPTPTALKPGATYGNVTLQVPLALGWWITGHAMGSPRGAEAGRDLLRAQISATSWTYALKYAVGRTRPNGDPRSFPSGHSSATFATAMVLQEHYGWKLGVPMFLAAAYTGAERVTNNKHWASDVAFGALVGVLAGRTVTLHVRQERLDVQPLVAPRGGGIMVRVQP